MACYRPVTPPFRRALALVPHSCFSHKKLSIAGAINTPNSFAPNDDAPLVLKIDTAGDGIQDGIHLTAFKGAQSP